MLCERVQGLKHAQFCDRVFDGDLFLAQKLTGLGQGTVKGKLMTLSEKSLNMFLSQMHMTCGYFNDKIHSIPPECRKDDYPPVILHQNWEKVNTETQI